MIASVVAVMASGCSAYRGASQGTTDTGGGYTSAGGLGQMTRGRQVTETGQVRSRGFGQSQRSSTPATCAPCGSTTTTAPKSTYTYKPAAKPAAPKPQAQTSQYNQQYYIDRWNQQQAQAKAQQQQPAQQPQQNTTNYAGYGAGTGTGSNTTYYDYSSAGGTANANTGSASTSNKSIYTGSYQQKTYKPYNPTTYSGGSAAATPGTATYANTAGTSSNGATYTVKKGDTVFEIMRQTGVYWKDIISLNNLTPPYNINPGQTLRLK